MIKAKSFQRRAKLLLTIEYFRKVQIFKIRNPVVDYGVVHPPLAVTVNNMAMR